MKNSIKESKITQNTSTVADREKKRARLPGLERYFPSLSQAQRDLYLELKQCYVEANQQLNLISRKDMVHFDERHLLHSLALARYLSLLPGTTVVDLGTGGGLPALPLAIFFPKVHFVLVDSTKKKIRVASTIASHLSLSNVSLHCGRIEQLQGSYDLALGRATAPLPRLLGWLHRVEKRQGRPLARSLCYWRGNHSLHLHRRPYQLYPLAQVYNEPWFATKQLVYLSLGQGNTPDTP